MQRHQAQVLIRLGLPRTIQSVSQIKHPTNVSRSDVGTLQHPAALRGYIFVLRERSLDLSGAELPLVVLAQIILRQFGTRATMSSVVQRLRVRVNLKVLQLRVLDAIIVVSVINLVGVLVLEAIQSVENHTVPISDRHLRLVEGDVVHAVVTPVIARQYIALRAVIQVPAIEIRAQVLVEFRALPVDPQVRVQLVVLQLLLLRAFHLHVVLRSRPVLQAHLVQSLVRRRAKIFPLALAARSEPRLRTVLKPETSVLRVDLEALALVGRCRVPGPVTLHVPRRVSSPLVRCPVARFVPKPSIHAVERARWISLGTFEAVVFQENGILRDALGEETLRSEGVLKQRLLQRGLDVLRGRLGRGSLDVHVVSSRER